MTGRTIAVALTVVVFMAFGLAREIPLGSLLGGAATVGLVMGTAWAAGHRNGI